LIDSVRYGEIWARSSGSMIQPSGLELAYDLGDVEGVVENDGVREK
jgi:hypothetical protein